LRMNKKIDNTRQSRRTTRSRPNTKDALRRAVDGDNVFRCDICCRMAQNIFLDRFRYYDLGWCTWSRVLVLGQFYMKRERKRVIILKIFFISTYRREIKIEVDTCDFRLFTRACNSSVETFAGKLIAGPKD